MLEELQERADKGIKAAAKSVAKKKPATANKGGRRCVHTHLSRIAVTSSNLRKPLTCTLHQSKL